MRPSFSSFQSACRKALVARPPLPASMKSDWRGRATLASGIFPREAFRHSSLASRHYRRSLNGSAGLSFIHAASRVFQNSRDDRSKQFHVDPSCFPKEAREDRHELPEFRQNTSTSGVCRHG